MSWMLRDQNRVQVQASTLLPFYSYGTEGAARRSWKVPQHNEGCSQQLVAAARFAGCNKGGSSVVASTVAAAALLATVAAAVALAGRSSSRVPWQQLLHRRHQQHQRQQ